MLRSPQGQGQDMADVTKTRPWQNICSGTRSSPPGMSSSLSFSPSDTSKGSPSPVGYITNSTSAKVLIDAQPEMRGFSLQRFCASPPQIELGGNATLAETARIALRLQQLTSGMLDSIKAIHLIHRNDPVASGEKVFFDEAGHADLRSSSIYLRRDYEKYLSPGIFQHETAHLHTYQLEVKEIHDMLDLIAKNEGSGEGGVKGVRKKGFEARWMEAHAMGNGNEFGVGVKKINENGRATSWVTADPFGSHSGPRNGCVESYGCQSFYEDVATHVQLVWEKPELYRELINPASEFYTKHPGQRGNAPIYAKKLDLLNEFGFIGNDKYLEITKPQSDLRQFCIMVNCPPA